MVHLKSIALKQFENPPDSFPFNLPIIQTLPEIKFTAPVTFLVGENGSGKSTLLEVIAGAAGSITVGSKNLEADETLTKIRKLARQFKLSWQKKTRKGFFLRQGPRFLVLTPFL